MLCEFFRNYRVGTKGSGLNNGGKKNTDESKNADESTSSIGKKNTDGSKIANETMKTRGGKKNTDKPKNANEPTNTTGLKTTEKKKKPPRKNSVDNFKSFLKNRILKDSKNKIDITNEIQFPEFAIFWKGYIKELKRKGLADTKHNQEIPPETHEKINELLVILFQLMTKSADDDEYKELLKKVPKSYYDEKAKRGRYF